MNIAIYARNAQECPERIEHQTNCGRAFATSQGWKVVGVFQDDGFSGNNMNRPAWKRLTRLIRQGKVDAIVVQDRVRIARGFRAWRGASKRLDAAGIKLFSYSGEAAAAELSAKRPPFSSDVLKLLRAHIALDP